MKMRVCKTKIDTHTDLRTIPGIARKRHRTLQPRKYQLSKSIVHEIKFGESYSCHVNIKNLLYSDMYFSTDCQFEMFKRGKANVHYTCLVNISKYVSFISVTYVVGTYCLIETIPMCTYNICHFNK